MGSKVPFYWEVKRHRLGVYSVLSKSKTVDMGRAAFWAAIDTYLDEMVEGETFALLHGSRIIMTARAIGHQEVEINRGGGGETN